MDLDEIDPEFRAAVRPLPALPFGRRRLLPVLRRVMSLTFRTRVVDRVTTTDVVVGSTRLRVYRPERGASGAGMLWMHGGGMLVGTEVQDNRICSSYALDLGMVVVSVGYRLAPQHPYPAAIDDCEAAWRWLVGQAAELGLDPGRLVIAGDSAGGGLAASLTHRIRDHHDRQPAAQVLLEPMLDDRTAADTSLDLGHYVWRWSDNRAGWSAYLGHAPGGPEEPDDAVPARRTDLTGLPPTWIGCGDKDLFFAESRTHAERLRRAGVEVGFLAVAGAPHGFHILAPDARATRAWWEDNHRFLARILDVTREDHTA